MKQDPGNTGNAPIKLTFHKEERLCSKKIIERLFLEGKTFLIFPIKVVYIQSTVPSKFPVQAGFSVGKKIFKRAVHRNFIKRRMREAYRLNKNELYLQMGDKQMAVFFIFVGKTIPEYALIESTMKKSIKKLINEIS